MRSRISKFIEINYSLRGCWHICASCLSYASFIDYKRKRVFAYFDIRADIPTI